MRKGAPKKRETSEASLDDSWTVPPGGGVRTIHVATRILDALAEIGAPARISDIARRLNMTMPTVSRHVATWRELGYVERAEPGERYRLGAKLFALGQAAADQNNAVNVAYPHLIELRDTIRETVLLCRRSQDTAVALLCIDSGLPTAIVVRAGTMFHMPYSPTARVLWAFEDDNVEGRLHSRSWDFSEQAGLNSRAFNTRVRAIRKNLFDFEPEVRGTGIGALSAPVFEHRDSVSSAITVVFPSRSATARTEKKILEPLQQCAAAVSSALGSNAWDELKGSDRSRHADP